MDDGKEQKQKLKWKEINQKIDNFLRTACIIIGLLVLFCGGVFQIVVYGIPLGNYEKDMYRVLGGIGMIGLVFVILLIGKLIDMLLEHLDRKQGNFKNEINPRKWPLPMLRTVKRTLIKMSMKYMLIAWDVVTGCILFAFVLAGVCQIMDNKMDQFEKMLFPSFKVLLICLIIRVAIIIFYYFRNYTKKMLHYSETYVGIRDTKGLLKNLQKSLKEDLLYYSSQWIITKDFFMAWCETDALFHPIVIPVDEMCHLKYEIRTTKVKRTTVYSAVIVCRLRNGKSVDLYVGNRFKLNVIWRVLQYFKVPFENTLTPDAYYEVPFEITVTDPKE